MPPLDVSLVILWATCDDSLPLSLRAIACCLAAWTLCAAADACDLPVAEPKDRAKNNFCILSPFAPRKDVLSRSESRLYFSSSPQASASEKQAADAKLAVHFDEVIRKAEKKARPHLKEKVTSAEQALRLLGSERSEHYRVVEYKGWWIVAWYESDSRPILWLHGYAIRKNSQDYYAFEGTW